MKFHHLNAFLAAVETGSIRGAARRLYLSQSALTKAIRELEEDLGAPLVRRSVRGIQLTEYGTRFLLRARLIARQAEQARSEIRQLQGVDEGSVSLGVTPLVALTVLPLAVAAFRKRFKLVSLSVVEGLEGIVLPGVRQGSLDFGIMAVAEGSLGEDLTSEPWFRAGNAVALREGHPQGQARGLAALADLEWLFTSFGPHGLGSRINKCFTDEGLRPPERVLRCESVLAALAIIRHSDVVTMLPSPLLDCPETQGIRGLALDRPLASNVFSLVTRVDVPLTPVAAAFAACLRKETERRFGSE